MTRLEALKLEKSIVKSLPCMSFDLKDEAYRYYDHEIECIEKYGSDNSEYKGYEKLSKMTMEK